MGHKQSRTGHVARHQSCRRRCLRVRRSASRLASLHAVDGAVNDSYRFNPWRAPGTAPVVDPCGQAGGKYPQTPMGGDSVFHTTNFSTMGDLGSRLPPTRGALPQWIVGSDVQVAWGMRFNHGGGYQVRMERVDGRTREARRRRRRLRSSRSRASAGPRLPPVPPVSGGRGAERRVLPANAPRLCARGACHHVEQRHAAADPWHVRRPYSRGHRRTAGGAGGARVGAQSHPAHPHRQCRHGVRGPVYPRPAAPRNVECGQGRLPAVFDAVPRRRHGLVRLRARFPRGARPAAAAAAVLGVAPASAAACIAARRRRTPLEGSHSGAAWPGRRERREQTDGPREGGCDDAGNNDHWGWCSGDWTLGMVADRVVVPKGLAPGKYVLGWVRRLGWGCRGGSPATAPPRLRTMRPTPEP